MHALSGFRGQPGNRGNDPGKYRHPDENRRRPQEFFPPVFQQTPYDPRSSLVLIPLVDHCLISSAIPSFRSEAKNIK
jgi:hypothetical protein